MADNSVLPGTNKPLDGGSCLNQRTILRACDVLFPSGQSQPPLLLGDLLEALWFIELAVVSNGISYDGTLPTRDLSELGARLDAVCATNRFPDGFFGAAAPKDEESRFLLLAAGAISAFEDLTDSVARTPTPLDRAFDAESAGQFFGRIEELRASAATTGGYLSEERLLDIANDKTLRGAKCIAGIASAGVNGLVRAQEIAESLRVEPGLAMAMFVNRFRFSYVRQLAYGASDTYVPGDPWRHLSQQHAVSFAETVRKHFAAEFGGRLAGEAQESLERQLGGRDSMFSVALPPLGLYALMKVRPNSSPAHVVCEARDSFQKYGRLFRSFWAVTREIDPPEEGWTAFHGDAEMDAVHEDIDRVLTDALGKLRARAARPSERSWMQRFLTGVKTFARPVSTIAGNATQGYLSTELGSWGSGIALIGSNAAGYLVGTALAAGAERLEVSLTGHVDDYRNLERALRLELGSLGLERLGRQVESVFGRKLVVV